MGKHFLVSLKVKGKIISRYYSLVLVNLSVWAESVRNSGFTAQNNYNANKTPGKLRIYVKDYDGGRFSPYVCGMCVGDVLNFKGPLGPGLCIQSIVEEDYLILAAGTGILPFLDVIYSIWQEITIKIRIFMYVTFRSERESFAIDLLQATARKYPKNLNLHVRLGDESPQIDQAMISKWINIDKLHKAWICGPSGFNNSYNELLIRMGLDRYKILLL